MTDEEKILREITGLKTLFDERTGENGIGGDIEDIKAGLQVQNGYVRANQIDIAQLQVREVANCKNAEDALEIAQDLRVTSAKQGGIWGTIVSAALIGATEAFRWLGTK